MTTSANSTAATESIAQGRRPRVAVIGAGVAGITASWKLQDRADVVLFENQKRLGGHTHTVEIPNGPDEGVGVDTGFIVLNDRTYPELHAFLAELEVPVRWSDMSFGYHDEGSGLQYSGNGLCGLLADPRNIARPEMWKLVRDFLRFNHIGAAALGDRALAGCTLGEFLRAERLSDSFRDHYLVPMGAAIWSTSNEEMLEFPLEVFLRFFRNHGLLTVADRPHWQTVVGGSHAYVKRFRELFRGRIVEDAGIRSAERTENGVTIHRTDREPERFDEVVIAVHADEVLPILADADETERRLFSPWAYQENHTVLHHDTSTLPSRKAAHASWNFTREVDGNARHPVSVTYDMVRLQGLQTRNHWLVTLNRKARIDPSKVVREIMYKHPTFTLDTIRAREEVAGLQGRRRTWFTGSWFGFGFHEDAVKASANLARAWLAVHP